MPSPAPTECEYVANVEQIGGATGVLPAIDEQPATAEEIVIINGLVIQLKRFTDDRSLNSYLKGLTNDQLNLLVWKPSSYRVRVTENILDGIRDEWNRRHRGTLLKCVTNKCAAKIKSMGR